MSTNHETLTHMKDVKVGSERSFAIVFAVVFIVVGLWPLTGGNDPRYWSLAVAAIFLGLGFFAPSVLKPLNILWFKFGMLLGRIVTPITMGMIFVLAVVPTGLFRQALGKDALRLKKDPSLETYWIDRTPQGPEAPTFKNQY